MGGGRRAAGGGVYSHFSLGDRCWQTLGPPAPFKAFLWRGTGGVPSSPWLAVFSHPRDPLSLRAPVLAAQGCILGRCGPSEALSAMLSHGGHMPDSKYVIPPQFARGLRFVVDALPLQSLESLHTHLSTRSLSEKSLMGDCHL